MYDPWRSRSGANSVEDDEMVTIIGAFDLTDAASVYDEPQSLYEGLMSYGDVLPASDSSASSSSHFYMDLTRLGTYLDEPSETTPTSPPQFYEGFYHSNSQYRPILTPTPPTPIPEFQVFDLTCFVDDAASRGSIVTPPAGPQRVAQQARNFGTPVSFYKAKPQTRVLYSLASPSQDYQEVIAAEYCSDYYPEIHGETETAIEEVRESEVVVLPVSQEASEENSTIHLTDFSRSSGWPGQSEDYYPFSSCNNSIVSRGGVGSTMTNDLFAIDCQKQLPIDTCDDQMFDQLCRGHQPADTSTVAVKKKEKQKWKKKVDPNITRRDRQEIRSCGTLPPPNDNDRRSKSNRKSSSHQTEQSRKKAAAVEKKLQLQKQQQRNANRSKSFHELPTVIPDSAPLKIRQNSTTSDDDEAPFRHDSNQSHTEAGILDDRKSVSSSSADSEGTSTTEDCSEYDVLDCREWMGNFINDLFDQDESKAIFYASSIAERHHIPTDRARKPQEDSDSKKKKKGSLLGDYMAIKDYCHYVLNNLDLAEVVENIDAGVYDNRLDDFLEDIELCLEDSIDKYETFLEHEARKWYSKHKDDGSVHTQQRHKELRLLAGDELMKQLETDFKMQLLDHFCDQISRQKQQQKKPRRNLAARRKAQRERTWCGAGM
ncbi:expressed unknown protein [Seminavis robusta]|uniref:Uncharacterized protein n=1 Tax=Seminavis robusta TaxID=568900 RepID=A0A9N8H3W7_9STRA|nr:expressed unknown protein [Seminavis robusta]|eukprot:Sro1_g000860.1 n/a (655) ;mRNA; f:247112-249076